MELATSVHIREMPVERFLYLKSIFVLKDVKSLLPAVVNGLQENLKG